MPAQSREAIPVCGKLAVVPLALKPGTATTIAVAEIVIGGEVDPLGQRERAITALGFEGVEGPCPAFE